MVAEFDLSAGVPESMQSGGLFQLPASRTFIGLVRAVERVAEDDSTRGVFVKLGAETLAFAQSEALARVFETLKRKRMPIVCHAHALDNATAWLATASCDRVWLSPAGVVETVGIASQLVYVKGLLDRLKIEADFVSAGRYKSFAETLTRQEPSPEARESLVDTLGSLRRTWLSSASRRRPNLGAALEKGPYAPRQAKAAGLIDAIGYETEALEDAKRRASTSEVVPRFGPRAGQGPIFDITEIVRTLAGVDDREGGRPRLVVVPAEGGITMRGGGLFEVGGITAHALQKTLRRLKDDDSVRAVVLRIDSPGGSALASDLIWHELMALRKKKPVVASIGSMAASGGYYLASAANRIFAEKTSIVGSIGVVGGKIVIGPALEQIGVTSVIVPASPEPGAAGRAAYLSSFERWDETMRDKVEEQIDSIYDLFIARVAEGRKKPRELIRKSAEGRIWSGLQGHERGLVDEIGGLAQALDAARRLGSLDRNAPVSVEGAADSLLEMLLVGEDASNRELASALERWKLKSDPLLAKVPAELRPFLKSMEPLFSGEHTVVALPFAMVVR
jgi:protease-4